MTTSATPTAPPSHALELQESLASRPSPLADDGTVLIHIIRPTVGKGRGKHLYKADMLQENADAFTGWKMYIDHQSSEAKKAAGGLPRSIRDLGGRIIESWWDDSVPAEGRFAQGAVVGRVKPVGQVKRLIEEDPELLEASIRAKASGVYPEVVDGEQVWAVEGIRRDIPGSVDWVSEGGAGGRIADLIEAMVEEADEPDPADDLGEDDNTTQGDDSVDKLEEALRDPESGVTRAVNELIEAKATEIADAKLQAQAERHETELEEAREEAKAEARAESQRQLGLRDLRDEAHTLIEAASLPEKMTARLKGEYELEGSEPTTKLDRADVTDPESGAVTKTAMQELREAVQHDIEEARELAAEAAPTRVTDQGPSSTDGDTPATAKPKQTPYWREYLQENGVDPDEAFDLTPAQDEPAA